MKGLEDTLFNGYARHLKNDDHQEDAFNLNHDPVLNANTALPSNDFDSFSKRRYSDRYGKAPDYFNFGYKNNFADAENSNATGFANTFTESHRDIFSLKSNDFKPLTSPQNHEKFNGINNPLTEQNASSFRKLDSSVLKEGGSANSFKMDGGGLKKHIF